MPKYLILNHIPRCGGSSLKNGIFYDIKNNQYFNQAPIYISGYTHGNISLYEQSHLMEAIHPETVMFIDQSPAFFIEDTFNLQLDDSYRILTLREPLSRIVSHIHFFYGRHIDTLSETILTDYLKKFGHSTISHLTKYKYQDKSLSQQYEEAKNIIKNYQFHFKVENQKLCEIFNSSNPFELHIKNYHINQSPVDSTLNVSQKTKNIIYNEIQLEIKLLETYYAMDL